MPVLTKWLQRQRILLCRVGLEGGKKRSLDGPGSALGNMGLEGHPLKDAGSSPGSQIDYPGCSLSTHCHEVLLWTEFVPFKLL